jgi:hypothetical protein
MTKTKELHRRNASKTSRDAAKSISPNKLEEMVLKAIRRSRNTGKTQDELLDLFPDFSYSSITARPAALKRYGFIVDSGKRRPGKSGRLQAVLVAKEFATVS